MAELRFDVTAEDIRLGKKCDSQTCPIARAMLRTFPNYVVIAGYYSLHVLELPEEHEGRPALNFRFDTPYSCRRFIQSFDRDWDTVLPEPFSFELEIPNTVLTAFLGS